MYFFFFSFSLHLLLDAGKSTIGGHVLYLSGMVEQRTLEKFEKESKELNRESWYLSWALDTSQEERNKVGYRTCIQADKCALSLSLFSFLSFSFHCYVYS